MTEQVGEGAHRHWRARRWRSLKGHMTETVIDRSSFTTNFSWYAYKYIYKFAH